MDHKEKMAFLKKMGMSVSRMDVDVEAKKKKAANRVEKSDLLALARTFNVHPAGSKPKQQTLNEFLAVEGKTE